MALATHQQGDPIAAVRYFERNRAACGPPGLFSEEYDIVERQLRGNLPQAFVHALMLESSVRLASHLPRRHEATRPAAGIGPTRHPTKEPCMSTPRTVVITGASAGIGRATAEQFAARGDNVALLARGCGRS